MAIRVRRGGITARKWTEERVDVKVGPIAENDSFPRSAGIWFDMPAAGGTTQVEISVPPIDFPAVMEGLRSADQDAAIHAAGLMLRSCVFPRTDKTD